MADDTTGSRPRAAKKRKAAPAARGTSIFNESTVWFGNTPIVLRKDTAVAASARRRMASVSSSAQPHIPPRVPTPKSDVGFCSKGPHILHLLPSASNELRPLQKGYANQSAGSGHSLAEAEVVVGAWKLGANAHLESARLQNCSCLLHQHVCATFTKLV